MPSNRCPDCNKWVSLETEEPEVETVDIDNESTVTATVTIRRNCADCGGEMKNYTFDAKAEIDEAWLVEHGPQEDGTYKKGHGDFSVNESGANLSESGGGRYAKNMIGFTCTATVTCKCESTTEVVLSDETAASSFEEVN